MTFTIVARCPESGQAGLALATVSLAAGGLVPFYTPVGDIVVSQAYARARSGYLMARELIAGASAERALQAATEADPHIGYRQMIILTRSGETVAFTGSDARSWAGHIAEQDVVVAGNVLAGPQVVQAMLAAYRDAASEPLEERLLRALEAGRDAGGQATGDGRPLAERAAMLRVLGAGEEAAFPLADLRVDVHASAVHELRRIHAMHAVYAGYATLRDNDPPATPSIVDYEARQLEHGGVFAERPSCFRPA